LDNDFDFERFTMLDLNREHAHTLTELPHHHKDPFDRMLICQALHEGLTILTPDRLFQGYPVPLLW
jgi:PIN domain nuclease of toxin-antitoxin system